MGSQKFKSVRFILSPNRKCFPIDLKINSDKQFRCITLYTTFSNLFGKRSRDNAPKYFETNKPRKV